MGDIGRALSPERFAAEVQSAEITHPIRRLKSRLGAGQQAHQVDFQTIRDAAHRLSGPTPAGMCAGPC